MKYLSLFSGIGGFELGIQQAYEEKIRLCRQQNMREIQPNATVSKQHDRKTPGGDGSENPTCIGYSEIDKYAIQIYQKHFPEHKNYGNITKLDPKELPEFDLLVGGFPCQSFSIAGRRGGFDDSRGTLFFEIARILKERRPPLLLLENVKGLLSHDEGRTFDVIITTLDELGYDLQWQVLNSKNFGVPQNRERVFIVGHLRGTSRPQVFPIGEVNPTPLNYIGGILSEKAKKWLDDGKQFSRNFPQGSRVYGEDGISSTLASQAGGLGAKTGLYAVKVDMANKQIYETDIAGTLQSRDYKGFQNYQHNNAVLEGLKIRRLTPTECERLQGFPDGWTEGVSDTQRYKCLGNAVTVDVIQAIAERLL